MCPMGSKPLGWMSAAVWYLRFQAAAGITWWALLFTSSAVRRQFELDPARHQSLDAFFLGDAMLFIAGSFLAGELLARHSTLGPIAAAVTTGASAGATLYLVNWVVLGGTGGLGIVPMVLATVATGTIAAATQLERTR